LIRYSTENLASILGVDVDTIKEYTKPMRKKLETLSKEQLIERFMKAKVCTRASLSTSLRLLNICAGSSRI